MNHSKAPWKAFGPFVEDADGKSVVSGIGPHDESESAANASLIAAAPDLLAAAILAEKRMEQLGGDGLASGLTAAIEKATN